MASEPLGSLFGAREFKRVSAVSGRDFSEFGAFSSMPLPTAKQDDWKFSSLAGVDFARMAGFDLSFVPRVAAAGAKAANSPAACVWAPEDKLEAGVKAFSHSFLHVVVPKNGVASVHFKAQPAGSVAAVTVVDVGEGASLDFYEEFSSSSSLSAFYGCKTVFRLAPRSRVNHFSFQRFGSGVFSLRSNDYRVADGARVDLVQAELGGSFSRVKSTQFFDGDGGLAGVNKTLFFGSGGQHFDFTSRAIHGGRNSKSYVLVKGCLAGSSSRVYRGLIKIGKSASGTSSFLHDRVLHLSKGVSSNSIPSLVIDNNDVSASHGTSVSRLDDDALFYLRSRGLPLREARQMAVGGFVGEVLSGVPDDAFKNSIAEIISQKVASIG